eukprot:m.241554 g.241554  ORF g.241554 m.241554 type:complete len:540 (+) comp13871_c0_seq1:28-1647(+)
METVVRVPLRVPLRIPIPVGQEDASALYSYLCMDHAAAALRVDALEEPSLLDLFNRAQSVKVVAATLPFLQGAFQDGFLAFLESKLSSTVAGGPPFRLDFILANPHTIVSSLRPIEDRSNSKVLADLHSLCELHEKYADLLRVHVVNKPLNHSTFSFSNCGIRVLAVVDHFEGLPPSCGNARFVSAIEATTYTAEFDMLSKISYRSSLQPPDPHLLEALDFLGLSPVVSRSIPKLESSSLLDLVELVVFSHPEPMIDEHDLLLPEHVIAVGIKPSMAKAIARRSKVYTSAASHREAIVRAALHFLPRATPLPPWIEGKPKNTLIPVSAGSGDTPIAALQFSALQVNYPDMIADRCATLRDVLAAAPGRRLLFHGTSVKGAESIVSMGVSTQAGHGRRDFTESSRRGYYVGDDWHAAVNRAYEAQNADEMFSAVVIHNEPADIAERGISVHDTNRATLVKSCRLHDRLPANLPLLTPAPACISGLMCSNPRYLGPPFHREPLHFFDRGVTQWQLCVLDQGLATEFTHSISHVVFIFSPRV